MEWYYRQRGEYLANYYRERGEIYAQYKHEYWMTKAELRRRGERG